MQIKMKINGGQYTADASVADAFIQVKNTNTSTDMNTNTNANTNTYNWRLVHS